MPVRKGVGLLGGTFDPVHLGHLRVAEEVGEAFGLSKVLLVPCHRPPHRPPPVAAPPDRLTMVRMAVRGNPRLEPWAGEIRRGGTSYSIETLEALEERGPLVFIAGMDAFREIPGWRRVDEIFERCSFVVVTRPNVEPVDLQGILDVAAPRTFCYDALQQRYMHRSGHSVSVHRVTPLGVSATELRRSVRAGRSIRYLVPEPVRAYIRRRGLYGSRLGHRKDRSLR